MKGRTGVRGAAQASRRPASGGGSVSPRDGQRKFSVGVGPGYVQAPFASESVAGNPCATSLTLGDDPFSSPIGLGFTCTLVTTAYASLRIASATPRPLAGLATPVEPA